MSRTLVVFAAVSGLMMSSALAQTPSSTSPAPATPAATSSSQQIINAQSRDEWLGSKLKGTAVIGADDQKIGEIADFLFDKTGHVKAFVVSIGGVLGIGAKEVALDMSAFHEMPAIEGKAEQFKVSMTKDQLKEAADFKALSNAPTTTGAAPPATPRPGPAVAPRPTPTKPPADK
jgi:PRC-barrel domain protein